MKNIIIYTHMPNFSLIDGGTLVEYYLAKLLDNLGKNVRIYPSSGIKTSNKIFSKFYNNDFPIDDNAVVIYCEGTQGNPLKATNVVRWLLSEMGKNVPYDWINGWGKNELVYFFNYDKIFENNEAMIGIKYKLLTCVYINPLIKNHNNNLRKGYCHTFRKSHYHKTLPSAHPPKSFEIKRNHTMTDYVRIFNKREIFISYDPLTFLNIIAAMCGCISVVIKVDGIPNQLEWLKTTAVYSYIKSKGLTKMYGIAYGIKEFDWAKKTKHLAYNQWIDIIKYFETNTIIPFLKDIENLTNVENTLENVFFSKTLI